ncbi:MAG: hypothetical protein L6R42_001151 [Xanthoria sp. 1 TBL-2021]|nr:MAG: hypothetical protein L6R42_001151 [Xanthoria sp. 1 TBL-2021]
MGNDVNKRRHVILESWTKASIPFKLLARQHRQLHQTCQSVLPLGSGEIVHYDSAHRVLHSANNEPFVKRYPITRYATRGMHWGTLRNVLRPYTHPNKDNHRVVLWAMAWEDGRGKRTRHTAYGSTDQESTTPSSNRSPFATSFTEARRIRSICSNWK